MASKYLQKFPIPGDFPDMLHDFAREVLRDQPEDIYEYGAAYFKAMEEVSRPPLQTADPLLNTRSYAPFCRALNSNTRTRGRRSHHPRTGSQARETTNRCPRDRELNLRTKRMRTTHNNKRMKWNEQ